MHNITKKAIVFLLTLCLMLSSAVFTPIFAQDEIPVLSNEYSGDYTGIGAASTKWSSVSNSYVYISDGNFVRVFFSNGKLAVSVSDSDGSVISEKALDAPLPLFGGFFAGEKYNFAVFGQDNPDESDEVTVVKVVKYSKDFNRLGICDISGINTHKPFDSGCLRMDEYGGMLYIHTSHLMYMSSHDGHNHQANMSFILNEESMNLNDSASRVWNLETGYVSHSFNQFIKVDNSGVYRVDHGDANPRAVVLTKGALGSVSGKTADLTLVDIDGNIGDNETGISVGGMEISDSNVLVSYSKTDRDENGFYSSYHGDIYLAVADKNLNAVNTIKITSYDSSSAGYTPRLVKINDNLLALMWNQKSNVSDGIQTAYCFIDSNGNRIGDIELSKFLVLSDCQPTVDSQMNVVWYAGDGSILTNYYINPACALRSLKTGVYSHSSAVTNDIEPTCTKSGIKGIKYCSECHAVLDDGEYAEPLGHDFSDGVCKRCGMQSPCAWFKSSIDEENNTYTLTIGAKNADFASSVVTGFTIPNGLSFSELNMPDDACSGSIQASSSGKYLQLRFMPDENGGNQYIFAEIVFNINTRFDKYSFVSDSSITPLWKEHGKENVFLLADYTDSDSETPTECSHEKTEIRGETAPTCTQDGSTGTVVCSLCGEVISQPKVIPALGHSFENGICTICSAEEPSTKPEPVTDPDTSVTEKPDNTEPSTDKDKPADSENTGLETVSGSYITVDYENKIIKVKPPKAGGITQQDFDSQFVSSILDSAQSSLIKNGNILTFFNEKYVIIVMGDVNSDGKITAADARAMLRIASKLDNANAMDLSAGDLNSDGKISASEARNALRFSARLSPELF